MAAKKQMLKARQLKITAGICIAASLASIAAVVIFMAKRKAH